jgi:hypothetical protein
MEDGRQGMAGNGFTSRVWKGDKKWAFNGRYLQRGYRPFLLFGERHEGIFQSSDA